MNPSTLSDKIKLVMFELLCHSNFSLNEALGDYDFVSNLVSRIFESDGADSPDKKINAIKAVRSCTGLGLRESKQLVERSERKMVVYSRFIEECDRTFRHGDAVDPFTMKNVVDTATRTTVDLASCKAECIDFIRDIPF